METYIEYIAGHRLMRIMDVNRERASESRLSPLFMNVSEHRSFLSRRFDACAISDKSITTLVRI